MKNSLVMKTSTASRLALAGFFAAAFLTSGLHAQSTWSGATSGNWSTSTNWDVAPVSGNTLDLVFGAASYANPVNYLGTTDYTVRSITFNTNADSTSGISLNDGGATARILTFDTDVVGGNASLTVDSGSSGNITIGTSVGSVFGTVALADNLAVAHSGSGTLTFDKAISGTGFGITKTGTGTLAFTVNSTFTGGLKINEGRVRAAGTNTATTDIGAGTVTLGGGTLEIANTNWTGAGAAGNKAYANSFVTTAATSSTIEYINTSGTARNITLNGGTTTLNGDLLIKNMNTEAGNAFAFSQSITGAGKLIYEGNNDLSANYSDRRLQISAASAGWSGGFELRKGGANFSGTAATLTGTGAITLGETAGTSNAGLYFNPGTNAVTTYANDFVVRSGTGLRSVRGVGGNTAGTNSGFLFTGNVTLEGTLNIDLNMAFASTTRNMQFSGNITGVGGVDLTRSATWGDYIGFNGTNTYSGNTTINANTELRLSGGNAVGDSSAVTLTGAGSELRLQNNNETIGSLASTATDGNLVLTGVTLTTGGNNQSTSYNGTSSGTGGITKAGSGVFTINSAQGYTGNTTITDGTLALGGAGVLGAGSYAGNIANAGALVIGTSANQDLSGVITGAGSFEQAGAGTTTLTNTASTFTGNVSVTGGILALNGDVNVANPTATVIGDTTVARTLTVASGATLRFTSSDAMGNAASTPLISIINNGGTIDNNGAWFNPLGAITLNGGTLTGTGGVIPQYQMYSFNGPVTVTDNATISGSGTNSGYHLSPTGSTTFDVAGGKILTASGTLVNRWGDLLDAGLTKTGSGTMVISGNNSYSGQTDIQTGIIRIQDSNALGTGGFSGTALSIVQSGASLEIDGSLALTEHIQIYGHGVGGNGAIRAISGSTTIGEWVALMAADSTVGVDTGAMLTMNRGFYEGAAGRSLTKVGGGTLTMAFENNYSGTTTVNAGILELATEGSNVLAPLKGDLVVNAGTARVTAANAIWGYNVANLKQATLNAGGTLTTVAGIATTLGNMTLNGGTLASEGAGDPIWGNWAFNQGAGTVTIAATDNSTISASRVLVNVGGGATDINVSADKSLNVSGELSSVTYAAHGFNKTGTGMLVLSGNNTYGGLTDITSGVVRITDSNALGAGGFSEPTMTTIQNGATLEIAGSLSIGEYIQVRGAGVGGSGAIRATSGTASMNMHVALMADTTIGVDSGATLNFSAGSLFNVGGFTKVGAGTMILSNTNAYSGGTTVSAGTLLVNNATGSGTGTGAVTVDTGGTLGGGGIITGLVTVNSGGTLSPGNSPGTLTQGATTLNSGGNINWQIVDVISFGGTDLISLTSGSALAIGSTSGSPFNINLWSLSSISPDVDGPVGNFVNTSNYTWTLVSTDQPVTGFSADKFTINVTATNGTGGFQNPLGGGSFAVALGDGGTDLVLTYTAIPEPTTLGLLAFGLATLAALRRRRNN